MAERILAGLLVVPFLLGAAAAPTARAQVVFSFRDPAIVESSGLVAAGGLVHTVNDSGDSGRVFVVDPADGETVGVTTWSAEPQDVEALAPDGDGRVWVGDIGDNAGSRDSVQVASVEVGRGDRSADAEVHDLTYPDGAQDAETLLRHPGTGRLYVASKSPFGGRLYAAPLALDPGATHLLRAVGDVLPLATDGAFFPDGRHLIVRSYTAAAVYAFPSLERVASLALPSQPQGEGLAVDAAGRVLLSSEGKNAKVLRLMLPADVRNLVTPRPAPASSSPSPSSSPPTSPAPSAGTESREDTELPETTETERPAWPWLLSGLMGVGVVLVLIRSLRRR